MTDTGAASISGVLVYRDSIRFRFDFLATGPMEDVAFSFDRHSRWPVSHRVNLSVTAGDRSLEIEILHGGGGQVTPTSTSEWSFDLRSELPVEISGVVIEFDAPTFDLSQALSLDSAQLRETQKILVERITDR